VEFKEELGAYNKCPYCGFEQKVTEGLNICRRCGRPFNHPWTLIDALNVATTVVEVEE